MVFYFFQHCYLFDWVYEFDDAELNCFDNVQSLFITIWGIYQILSMYFSGSKPTFSVLCAESLPKVLEPIVLEEDLLNCCRGHGCIATITTVSDLSSYPGYFWKPHWKWKGFLEISSVVLHVCNLLFGLLIVRCDIAFIEPKHPNKLAL